MRLLWVTSIVNFIKKPPQNGKKKYSKLIRALKFSLNQFVNKEE